MCSTQISSRTLAENFKLKSMKLENTQTKEQAMLPWIYLCCENINDILLPGYKGTCATSIHVFLWGFTVLKIFNDPNSHSQCVSHFWSCGSADTSQPISLNFLSISTEAGSWRWESITHLQNTSPDSINSAIQFRRKKKMWLNSLFLLSASVDCLA